MHLEGVITFYDPSEHELFIQDETGGIYINTTRSYPLHLGDLLDVKGRTDSSYRTEVADGAVLTVVGHGKVLHPPLVSYPDLIAGRSDCRLIRVRGLVRAANIERHVNAPSAYLDLLTQGGRVEVFLANGAGFAPESMLDSEVEITGVSGSLFDAKNQTTGAILYAAQASSIRVLRKAPHAVDQLSLTPIDNVFETRYVSDTSSRVRVRGTITYYKKGQSAVLQNNSKSIFVQTRQTNALAVGDVVDAYGFGSGNEYAPSLRDALLVKTGATQLLAPRAVSYAEAFSGLYSDNLISLSGILISQLRRDGSEVLVLDVDGHLVTGYLDGGLGSKPIPVGSRVNVVGICRVTVGGPWLAAYSFHLDMRSEADIHVLEAPSWWTVTHLVPLLGLLALVSVVTAIWALILRRRNLRQTGRIQRSMRVAHERSRILEQVSSNASPGAVLSQISAAVGLLMPEFDCSYSLATEDQTGRFEQAVPEQAWREGELRTYLKDTEGHDVGLIVVTPPDGHLMTADEVELVNSLTELSNLAVRQSLLYKGLLHHSTHDALTDLPNRRLCELNLCSAIEWAAAQGSKLAVIYIDIDKFKEVNDRFGHKAGDTYLITISQRLARTIRPSDTLARIGGDEFLIIVPLHEQMDDPSALSSRFAGCFSEPFLLEGEQIKGSASFGLAVYPDDGKTSEDLKRHADYAMYLAKRSLSDGHDRDELSVMVPSELEAALQREEFSLVYQPQFSVAGRLTGLEVLLRLNDSILGIIRPDAFIAVAERSGIICDIGEWVLRKALSDAVRWGLDKGKHVLLAVNISMRQLERSGFAKTALESLAVAGFPADRLELELVERSIITTSVQVKHELEELRAAGVRVALDDFGTGESCLSILHTLPVDTIKIDRSFILAMDSEPKVLPIIQAISYIARSLGKRIVAEGLEHVGPVAELIAMGPVEFQGYLFGRPLPAQDVDDHIGHWRADVAMPKEFGEYKVRLPLKADHPRSR